MQRSILRELVGIFAAPKWLRDVGLMSWLLVGVAAFLVGAIWLLRLVGKGWARERPATATILRSLSARKRP